MNRQRPELKDWFFLVAYHRQVLKQCMQIATSAAEIQKPSILPVARNAVSGSYLRSISASCSAESSGIVSAGMIKVRRIYNKKTLGVAYAQG